MNIGLFTDTYYPEISGVASSIEILRKALIKRGHNVYIFTTTNPYDKGDNQNVFRLPSMPFIFFRSRRVGLFYAPWAAQLVKKLGIDVIHTQTEFSLGMFGKIMSKQIGIPVVHTYHTLYKEYFYYISKGYFKRLSDDLVGFLSKNYCNGCNAIIAPTEKVYDLLKSYDVKKPVRIIPTGIEIERFGAKNYSNEDIMKIRHSLDIPEEAPVILFIGRVAKEKSIDMIIRQMPKILEKIPKAKLVIVGDGLDVEDLEILSDLMGVRDSVIFAGERPWDEIGAYYHIGDVFVNSSVTETQGLTFIEAMASGLPVVARADKSIEGLIQNGQNGIMFTREEELSEKIIELLTNRQLADSLAKNAENTVLNYASEEFARKVEELYLEVIRDYKKKPARRKLKTGKKS